MPSRADSQITTYKAAVEEAVEWLKTTLPYMPRVIIQLGTGLGSLADQIEADFTIPYEDIPNFPHSTVNSHQGNLIVGKIAGKEIAVLQGRFHYYEGYSTKEVSFGIRVLSLLGAELLIVTNAAGGLNPLIAPGTIVIIQDHMNFLGENPLRGPNVDEWGPRFPDFSVPYHPGLIKKAFECARLCDIDKIFAGVYACIPGPSLETPAETRWLINSGADTVGMSTVPEVIVATHAGMNVLGLSVVSNVNNPDNFQPILLDDIIAASAEVEPKLTRLVQTIIGQL